MTASPLGLGILASAGATVLVGLLVMKIAALVRRERRALGRVQALSAGLSDLSLAHSQLRAQAERKTQSFANVSHELRTPLTLILGPLQSLREASELSAEQRASLAMIERNAQLLLGHVNDLLELTRADAVGVTLTRKATDVVLLLSLLTDGFRSLAAELGIRFDVRLPSSVAPVFVDPEKVERIAMNLLANAFKFTPKGGQVAFFSEIAATPEGTDLCPELRIAVDDTGPGVRAQDRELVFERFQQLDAKPNRAFGGTGLGLAIVKHFVAACSGSVWIEDSTLGGARFVVRLPAEPVDAPHDSEREGFPQSGNSAEMLALRPSGAPPFEVPIGDLPLVLVVEDNPDMNSFVCTSLSGEFRVVPAFDGEQALSRLETLSPDLIITDFMMPRMSGTEFVRALRGRPTFADIPVLVLTARDDIDLRIRALSDGVQDWLAKPFTVRELLARARNLVSARRARTILRAELASREFDVGALAAQLADRKRRLESLLESLSHALEQAEVASRFKTSLLRLVSHELRTPLGALQLQLERLSGEHRGPLNEAQQQLVVRMRRSLSRLTDTIQSLLEYARIESGRLHLCIETFDIFELARSVIDDFMPQAESKGLELRLVASEGHARIDTDARLTRLVLVNLVANALQATEQGAVVVSIELRDQRCELKVEDTGPGIEPGRQTSIFEPFFQGESVGHREYSRGAGLGLSLVKEMLQALAGTIELKSELGVGSTFRVSIPSAGGASRGLAAPSSERGS